MSRMIHHEPTPENDREDRPEGAVPPEDEREDEVGVADADEADSGLDDDLADDADALDDDTELEPEVFRDPEAEPGHRLAQLIDRLRQKLSRDAGSNDQAASAPNGLPSDRQPESDSGQFASSNQSGQIEQRNMAGASERRDRQETITLAPGSRDRTRW